MQIEVYQVRHGVAKVHKENLLPASHNSKNWTQQDFLKIKHSSKIQRWNLAKCVINKLDNLVSFCSEMVALVC